MADKNQKIEDEDKVDQSTEDKSDDTKKKIEISDQEESIPDYDVVEEGNDKSTQDDDDRLAKDRKTSSEKNDHKDLTNREKRQLKKKRIAEKFDAKDALIRQQQEQLNAMAARLNDVDGRLSSFDQAQFTQVWNSSVEAYQAAEKKHADAFSAGDGAAATAAMREMYIAQKRIDEMEVMKARQGSQQQPQRQQQSQGHDQRVINKAKEWAERNEWFVPGNTDDDSVVADAIAAKLVREGYDPKTDDYYDELDERLQKRGIGQTQQDDDDHQPVQRKAPVQRKSPPIGGGNGRGDMGTGKTQITLPTNFINALKESGIWDDPKRRNRAILEHQRIREEGNR